MTSVHDNGRDRKAQPPATEPIRAGVAVRAVQPIAEPPQKRQKSRVTFIEDDPDAFAAYRDVFVGTYEVSPTTHTTSLATALEIVRREKPEVLITDLHFQPGTTLDGLELAKIVRDERPATLIILCSGTDSEVKGENKGYFDHILTKPIGIVALEQIIATGLALPRIAVFDDNLSVMALCQRVLKGIGRIVYNNTIVSVDEAMAVFERDRPPIVVTDLNLTAGGGEGFEILRRIRDIAPDTIVILHSDSYEPGDEKMIAQMGFNAGFNKGQAGEMAAYIAGLKK